MHASEIFFLVLLVTFGGGFLLPVVQSTLFNLRSKPDRGMDGEDHRAGTSYADLPSHIRVFHTSLALALAGGLTACAMAIHFLLHPQTIGQRTILITSSWLNTLPSLRWEIRIDKLSAFFVLLIGAFAAAVAIYSFSVLKDAQFKRQRNSIAGAFNLFAWSTLMVVIANDLLSMITALEVMTLSFAFLALFKYRYFTQDSVKAVDDGKLRNAFLAPQVYLFVSHISTMFITLAILPLAINAQSLSFNRLYTKASSVDPTVASIVFLLALCGLGIRAGLVPAHFWVPLVHPSSPTPTHAFSLGIAIKVAIYLMLRFFFRFLEPQEWWGYLVLMLAAVTALVNVWYAISGHDLKVALAYHSIENIGIILVGIGVALVFTPNANRLGNAAQWITSLALAAALYHLLNHAIFKGLLYFATGAIDNLTHEVEFDRLGGLIKLYPVTTVTFLIGAVSISGFPPFNGFVSEWLTLNVVLEKLRLMETENLLPVGIVLLSLLFLAASFALTAFCFVKISGITLLGTPRTSLQEREEHWKSTDVPRLVRGVLTTMAILCLGLGLFPALFLQQLLVVVQDFRGISLSDQVIDQRIQTSLPVQGIELAALTLVIIGVLHGVSRLGQTKPRVLRPEQPWNCGTPYNPATMQYTGTSLSFLIRGIFASTYNSEDALDPNVHELESRFVVSLSSHRQIVKEYFREVYNGINHGIQVISERIGQSVQTGDLRRYLLYIFLINIFTLLLFAIIAIR